jgi:hypothetical protein
VSGFTVSYTGVGGSGFRVPSLVEVGRTPKGRFLHPIYGDTYRLVSAADNAKHCEPAKNAPVLGHLTPALLGANRREATHHLVPDPEYAPPASDTARVLWPYWPRA